MQYQLLILRTYRYFYDRVWFEYDQTFREHAATLQLTDWSSMNIIYSAGSSARGTSLVSSNDSPEPVPPCPLFIANPGIRSIARLHLHSAATLIGAVCAQAFIG